MLQRLDTGPVVLEIGSARCFDHYITVFFGNRFEHLHESLFTEVASALRVVPYLFLTQRFRVNDKVLDAEAARGFLCRESFVGRLQWRHRGGRYDFLSQHIFGHFQQETGIYSSRERYNNARIFS